MTCTYASSPLSVTCTQVSDWGDSSYFLEQSHMFLLSVNKLHRLIPRVATHSEFLTQSSIVSISSVELWYHLIYLWYVVLQFWAFLLRMYRIFYTMLFERFNSNFSNTPTFWFQPLHLSSYLFLLNLRLWHISLDCGILNNCSYCKGNLNT